MNKAVIYQYGQFLKQVLIAFKFLCMLVTPHAAIGQSSLSIAYLQDGDNDRLQREKEHITSELTKVLGHNYNLEMPDSLTETGSFDWKSVERAYERLSAKEYDYLIAIGPLSSHLLSQKKEGKPRLAPYVFSPSLQKLPYANDTSGIQNLTYLYINNTIADHLAQLKELASTKRAIILLDKQTQAIFQEPIVSLDKKLDNIQLHPLFIDTNNPNKLDTLSGKDTDGILVSPFWSAGSAKRKIIYQNLNDKGIPSITMAGEGDVKELNAPAAIYDDSGLTSQRARRIAMAIQEDIMGRSPGQLTLSMIPDQRLCLNMAAINQLGLRPNYTLLNEAKIFESEIKKTKESDILTLSEAVKKALNNNQSLKQSELNYKAQSQEVRRARSNLLPQLEAKGDGLLIDSDRAEASFGTQPERTIDVGGTLSQVIFSEKAWANYSIQKKLNDMRRQALKGTRMDIMLETAEAYVTVLKAQKLKNIKQENISVTRANLNRAQRRKETGIGNPGEVYRWEAKLANERQSLIKAQTQLQLAQQYFNKITGRAVDDEVKLDDTPLSSPALVTSDSSFYDYIDDPWSFEKFRSYMVQEGLERAPEMKQVEEAIKARERALTSARLSYFLPEIGVQAGYNYRIYEDGAGTEIGLKQELQQLPPTMGSLSGLANSLPKVDDKFWNVGVKVTFPLFNGLERQADRVEARQKLKALKHKKAEVRRKLEQKIRVSLEQAGSSHSSIKLAQEAAEAADKNLELVTDSYDQGIVSIQEVLDAQETARTAREAAATARYEFLLDVMKIQRVTNHFEFFTSREKKSEWMEELESYMKEPGSYTETSNFQ